VVGGRWAVAEAVVSQWSVDRGQWRWQWSVVRSYCGRVNVNLFNVSMLFVGECEKWQSRVIGISRFGERRWTWLWSAIGSRTGYQRQNCTG
jgi:hypothetical protein